MEDNGTTIRHFRGLVVDEIEMREHARDLEKMVDNLCMDPYIQLAANYWTEKEKQVKESPKLKFLPFATLKRSSGKENSNNNEACDNKKGKGIQVLDVMESLALLEAAKKKQETVRVVNSYSTILVICKAKGPIVFRIKKRKIKINSIIFLFF